MVADEGLGLGVAFSRDRPGGDAGIGDDVAEAAGALLEFDVGRRGRSDGITRGSWPGVPRLGTPLPSFRRLPVERDGDVQWRTTVGVMLLRVGF